MGEYIYKYRRRAARGFFSHEFFVCEHLTSWLFLFELELTRIKPTSCKSGSPRDAILGNTTLLNRPAFSSKKFRNTRFFEALAAHSPRRPEQLDSGKIKV